MPVIADSSCRHRTKTDGFSVLFTTDARHCHRVTLLCVNLCVSQPSARSRREKRLDPGTERDLASDGFVLPTKTKSAAGQSGASAQVQYVATRS